MDITGDLFMDDFGFEVGNTRVSVRQARQRDESQLIIIQNGDTHRSLRITSLGRIELLPSLDMIAPVKLETPHPAGWFSAAIHDINTLHLLDNLGTEGKHDEAWVNGRAKEARFGTGLYLIVVSNYQGKATAIYQDGVRIA